MLEKSNTTYMIGLIGLNHKSAPIEIREKFVFCEEDIKRFGAIIRETGVVGIVIISTCNRSEIYFEAETSRQDEIIDAVEKELLKQRKAKPSVRAHFYHKKNGEVARHLFRVISGLDSMALGEYQIVGQVKDAYQVSLKHSLCSTVITRLFTKSFEIGKRVRTETLINQGAVSISYAGVELAGKKLHNLSSKPVLLVGAGQTGELTLVSLIKKGCNNITITNRTSEKAEELAAKYNGKTGNFKDVEELILDNDIIISSTASKKPIFTKEIIEKAMLIRRSRPLFFIDLSVPRNVSFEASDIENVYIYDIDALNEVIMDNIGKRQEKIIQAEEIIQKGVDEFNDWLATRNLAPAIQSLSSRFQDVSKAELDRFIRSSNDNFDYNKALKYGSLITNKFIHILVQNVKNATDNGRNQEYVNLVNELFDQKQA